MPALHISQDSTRHIDGFTKLDKDGLLCACWTGASFLSDVVIVLCVFARAVKQCLYTFKLLDDYYDESPRNDGRLLPAALSSYLAYRIMHEPAKGNPFLTSMMRVVEHVRGVDCTQPQTTTEYVENLCCLWRPSVTDRSRGQRWREIFHRTSVLSEDEYQQHLFAAAIHTNNLSVTRRCIAKDDRLLSKLDNLESEILLIGCYRKVVAEYCNTEVLGYLLTVGETVVNKRLRSNLFCDASEYSRADIVKFLYDFERVNVPWDFTHSWTCDGSLVHRGPRTADLEVLKFFEDLHKLNRNPEIDAWNNDAMLWKCASAGRVETVDYLLRQGANAEGCHNMGKPRANEPIRYAAMWNHQVVVDLLLQHGASAEAAIDIAVKCGRTAIVQRLLHGGATLKGCLSVAAARGHWDMIRVIVEAGADVNESTGVASPLVSAIGREHTRMFKFLLEKGADLYAKETAKECVKRAKKDGLKSMLLLLENHGIDIGSVQGED
ncbi:ankyrin [Lophiostoma macrostomum CBS 122681]|uniref:Ankyrin n=1 Tax=Lophiostoma macrostomum CBS 122681 TaxID=1314788 RepID=A0A6A6T035_9PLEO|nr:ankyrin [Lophiostoma macrostomum CBS 122681]